MPILGFSVFQTRDLHLRKVKFSLVLNSRARWRSRVTECRKRFEQTDSVRNYLQEETQMRNTKFTRILSLALACLFLVSSAVVSVGAAAAMDSNKVTSDMIADYKKELGTISYELYMEEYADFFSANSTKPHVGSNKVYDLTEMDLVYEDAFGNVIEITNNGNSWKLIPADGSEPYTSVQAALDSGEYEIEDLVFIAGKHYAIGELGSTQGVYTPSTGDTTWTLDLAKMGITESTLSGIQFVYYPIYDLNGDRVGKAAAIERRFALGTGVDVAAPFKEARSLRLSKIWESIRYDKDGNALDLVANYYPTKKESITKILEDGKAIGLTGTVKTDSSKKQYIEFVQPKVITEAIDKFIDTYGLRFFVTDVDNNELRPEMVQAPEWITYDLKDSSGFYSDAFGFVLTPDANGNITMILEGVNEPMVISQVILTPYEKAASYETYKKNIENTVGLTAGKGTLQIEAEYTINTSTNVVYPLEDRTSPITSPTSTKKVYLNTIGTEKWATSGQWVEYQFSVDSSGMYDMITRFKQSYLDGLYVNRLLEIYTDMSEKDYLAKYKNTCGYYDGVPFAEAGALRFDYDTDWQTSALTNGNDSYQVYLEAGVVYTIRFEVTLGSMSELVSEVEDILNHLNDDYLKILKLTGSEPDDYRDYNFYGLLPNVIKDMYMQIGRLEAISKMLKETAGVASTYSGICDQLTSLLSKMVADEKEIAKNLDNYKSYVGSLGTFLTDAKTQPLQFDYILIQPANTKLPKAEGNFFQRMLHEFSSFFQSFFRDYNSMGAMETDSTAENIEVWMVSGAATDEATYGRDQLQVVRNMCTNDFTNNVTNGKIAVDLKLVSGGTLLPSILAGLGPDVYMGLPQGSVINYAIRGALQEVEGLKDFDSVTKQFNDAALIVLRMKDADGVEHYYGLPETQQFPMMFVRIDILADLGIEVPTTWDDVYNVQAMLQSNNMEIGLTTNYKMFLYQMGGELFADDGMRINLDSSIGEKAFTKMCDMFTQYSFPYKYNAANRFRTGEMPIIISEYVGLYNQLKVFATELDGCWAFVPLPGIMNEETGEINNSSISNASASVMIKGTEKIDASWEYMKWFTGDNAQAQFSNEMVAIIGDSAKHPTANISALENMPWTQAELAQVRAQFNNLASVPNYPGYYILDRYTNFAFLSAYNDDADPVTELRSYINTINNEITRKREEFKLETLEIGQTLADKRMAQAEEAVKLLREKYNKTAYAAVLEEAEMLISNMKVSNDTAAQSKQLSVIAATMMELLPNEGTATPSYFVKVSKQTSEEKYGGYKIESLSEQKLLYFTAQCFIDAANALSTY